MHAVHRWIRRTGAVVPGTYLADRFGTFGARSLLNFPVATLFGERGIHIGSETLIGPYSTLSVGHTPDDVHAPERGLVIGDRCVIGARAILTAHESIVIGDDVWFGQNVFVSDASHGYQDVETPIGLQLGWAHPVEIGAGTWIGHGVIVLPGSRIGRNVVIGGGSVVGGDIPDHSVAVGVPAKVVRRLDPAKGWVSSTDPGDVRPAWTAEQAARLLSGEE
ncbi:acyltransferase [Nocardioides marmorisolisilvae]|uniref:Acyltransferase n=1 Tax=Nocardioides marmorisolisilvae TaxID=1542737 RepID=A0A3N0DXT0_9ACTN|nr:acyltransferase [Nocardioides marmorisolisilvae]